MSSGPGGLCRLLWPGWGGWTTLKQSPLPLQEVVVSSAPLLHWRKSILAGWKSAAWSRQGPLCPYSQGRRQVALTPVPSGCMPGIGKGWAAASAAALLAS